MENPPDNTHLDTGCIGCSPCPMTRQHPPPTAYPRSRPPCYPSP
nr:MAG TPA: hypothetical protein [Caudoviricetes sp.]